MENQLDKTKKPNSKKRKIAIVFLGFAGLAVAILLVNVLTGTNNTNINNKPRQTPPARLAVVRITKTGFEPATLSVKQGTKITWTNTDNGLHQVAANPYPRGAGLSGLKSEILNNTQTYTFTANQVGSFGYHDQIKPTINGTLVVQK